LKASFQPCNYSREIRNLVRHRDNLQRSAAKEVQHMQKYMELMNIKLTNVISDILGVSGQAIITAINKGERDPKVLAALADSRCKSPRDVIEKSLDANWDENLLFTLKQSFELYHFIQKQMIQTEKKAEKIILKYQASLPREMVHPTECKRSDKAEAAKNKISIDIEQYAHEFWGVNIMRVPGISKGSTFRLLGELGHDFTDKFETCKHFCNWGNLVPNNKITGGKLISSKVPKRKNPVGQILRVAANSLMNEKSPMGNYFRKIRARKGHNHAIVATANKIGKIIYSMVKNQTEYDEALVQEDITKILKMKLKRTEKELERIKKQLSECA